MSFYSEMAVTATELLAEFGRVVTITRTTQSIDPVTGVRGSAIVLSGSFTVINPPITEDEDDRLVAATLIDDNVRRLIVAASNAPFAPRSSDTVAMDGKNWNVKSVTPVSPAGVVLIYKLGLEA